MPTRRVGPPPRSQARDPRPVIPSPAGLRIIVLKSVFLVGRLDRAAPGAVELVQHLLGGRPAAIDDPVERLEMAGLVMALMIDPGPPPQTRTRQRPAPLGALPQISGPCPRL